MPYKDKEKQKAYCKEWQSKQKLLNTPWWQTYRQKKNKATAAWCKRRLGEIKKDPAAHRDYLDVQNVRQRAWYKKTSTKEKLVNAEKPVIKLAVKPIKKVTYGYTGTLTL